MKCIKCGMWFNEDEEPIFIIYDKCPYCLENQNLEVEE